MQNSSGGGEGLVITKETDYALRILRALRDGELRTVGQVAKSEFLPQAFAYKILKKLEKAGLIQLVRGSTGGCRLAVDLSQVSLYDLMAALGERSDLSACMADGFQCPWRQCHSGCRAHNKLLGIQRALDRELRAHTLGDILAEG